MHSFCMFLICYFNLHFVSVQVLLGCEITLSNLLCSEWPYIMLSWTLPGVRYWWALGGVKRKVQGKTIHKVSPGFIFNTSKSMLRVAIIFQHIERRWEHPLGPYCLLSCPCLFAFILFSAVISWFLTTATKPGQRMMLVIKGKQPTRISAHNHPHVRSPMAWSLTWSTHHIKEISHRIKENVCNRITTASLMLSATFLKIIFIL